MTLHYRNLLLCLLLVLSNATVASERDEQMATKVTYVLNLILTDDEIQLVKGSSDDLTEEYLHPVLGQIKSLWGLGKKEGRLYNHFLSSGFSDPNVVTRKVLRMYKLRLNGSQQPQQPVSADEQVVPT